MRCAKRYLHCHSRKKKKIFKGYDAVKFE